MSEALLTWLLFKIGMNPDEVTWCSNHKMMYKFDSKAELESWVDAYCKKNGRSDNWEIIAYITKEELELNKR